MFDCINRALQLKDAITSFAKNDMELDGRIDGEDDENTSDGEAGRVVEEMVRTTHPHSLLFLYIHMYIAKVCVFVVFAVIHLAGVWAYISPLTIGHAMSN